MDNYGVENALQDLDALQSLDEAAYNRLLHFIQREQRVQLAVAELLLDEQEWKPALRPELKTRYAKAILALIRKKE